MRIDVICADFSTLDPVAGVRVACRVEVAPRITRIVGVSAAGDGPVGPIPVRSVDDDNHADGLQRESPFLMARRTS